MKVDWEETIPLQTWLPRKSPTRGLLAGDGSLAEEGRFAFSADIATSSRKRTISPSLAVKIGEYHRAADAPAASLDNVERLAKGARAVVTGQQAGLLCGPLYTFLKAATAIRLAEELSRRSGEPYVPVFWAEAGDHDLSEFNHAVVLDKDAKPRVFEHTWPEQYRQGPAGLLPLGEETADLVRRFFEAAGETEFSGALRREVLEDLQLSDTVSQWFCRQMMRRFGSRGLVVFDSFYRPSMQEARQLWVQVLEEPLALTNILRQAGEELSQKGYRPVLFKEKRRCPFFLVTDGKREPVFFERGSFRAGDLRYTPLELRRRLDENPEDFSPGVNLRPLLQDTLLPTAAFVVGPTELAYLYQVLPGYRWADIPPPVFVLRAGATFIDPSASKVLHRQRLSPASLRKGSEGALGAVLRRENRLADPERWKKLREACRRPLDRFAAGLEATETDIEELLRKNGGKIDFLLKDLEKRVVANLRRRSDVLRSQLDRCRNRLYPTEELQERVLSPYYFLNKYGPDFTDTLIDTLPTDFTVHHFGTIIS